MAHKVPLSMEFSRQEYWSGVAVPLSRESSQPRDRTQVSCIAGGFFYHLSHQAKDKEKAKEDKNVKN